MSFFIKTRTIFEMQSKFFGLNFSYTIQRSAKKLNLQSECKLRLITSEIDLLRHREPQKVPDLLTSSHLEYLMTLQKIKRYRRTRCLDLSYQLRQDFLQKLCHLQRFDGTDNIMLPFVGSENEKLLRRRQVSMTPFLPNLIFDISFDEHMSSLECKNLAEQLIYIFHLNKFGIEDDQYNFSNLKLFNLHLTNLKSSVISRQFLDFLFDPCFRHYFPNVFLHEKSFENVFKGKQLVYLSPHANETITEYDDDVFYIIGGIVDRREIVELTPTKCNQLGIRSQKLPIESFVSKQVQSLYDVYKLLHEFKYNPLMCHNVSTLVKKHLKFNKRKLN